MITSGLKHKSCLTSSSAAEAVTEGRQKARLLYLSPLLFSFPLLPHSFEGLIPCIY